MCSILGSHFSHYAALFRIKCLMATNLSGGMEANDAARQRYGTSYVRIRFRLVTPFAVLLNALNFAQLDSLSSKLVSCCTAVARRDKQKLWKRANKRRPPNLRRVCLKHQYQYNIPF